MTYEVVKNIGVENTPRIKRESNLVKLGEPVLCRGTGTTDLYAVDHVIVEALTITEDGQTYGETHVVASDEQGAIHPAVLYLGTKALTVPEAMFSIGEHNYIEPESEEPTNA